jgi:predicted regulator of Ras-like GTPase activity (Roadblock/LC7/MglB family)
VSSFDWMAEAIAGVERARHAVILTADGLLIGQSQNLERDAAERIAGGCSALMSLGQGIADEFGSSPVAHQVMVEFDGGFLFVRGAGNGSRLAVVTAPDVDPALIATEMARLVQQLGAETLATPARGADLS